MEPGKPPEKFKGSEIVRSIGGLWVQGESRGEMPGGGSATMVITLGYDPQKERYVGTFIGSMMTHLWLYDGSLDSTEKVLTLNTEGPTCTGEEKLARYKDVIELKSADHRVMTSQMLGDDGVWSTVMTANYYRKK
ncbi:MAG: DUF1579 domain-containing protein [Methylococcales bacterium]|nr:DUF1579 domain-containing protein [Methylococcales bacterium]